MTTESATPSPSSSSDIGVQPEHLSHHFGDATNQLIEDVFDQGAQRAVVLMRHSARTFDPSINDLLNKLTDHGRNLSAKFGRGLPKDIWVRGYASPPERCMETAELAIASHLEGGGVGGRTRPVEALGVFYALDQQRMWKALSLADGLADFVGRWFEDQVAHDAVMPAPLAVNIILKVMGEKLRAAPAQVDGRSLDLLVTHDMTVFLMRHGVGLEPAQGPTVEFLDGLIMYEKDGCTFMRSHHGGEVEVDTEPRLHPTS